MQDQEKEMRDGELDLELRDDTGEEMPREVREIRQNREFLKGVLFGVLAASVAFMTFLLFRFGTFGAGKADGADILTTGTTDAKIGQIADLIDDTFLYEADSEMLETMLFKGIAAGLDDPYAAYYSATELKAIQQENAGEFFGMGITFTTDTEDGAAEILSVYADSPAERAGIQVGDILEKVGDTDCTGMTATEIAELVTAAGEEVTVTVRTDGESRVLTMTLEKVQTAPVTGEMLEDRIGYIKIPEFDEVTVEQFEDALTQLKDQGMESLIIDLRNNPGGLLDSVCDILDDLLADCVLVSTVTRDGVSEEIRSDEDQLYDGTVAVLVNGNSASASEVFTGAIQDYERGPVIGTQTYGKGVVQRTYQLSDGSAFKLTTEKYLTAGGRDINGDGITPDIEVQESDKEGEDLPLERAMKELKNQ